MKGEIMGYIDVAQVTLYVFWAFFAGLLFYLLRENRREGYPMETERPGVTNRGYPNPPAPKTYILPHGGTKTVPVAERDTRVFAAEPTARFPGAPFQPTGNPMTDGVGPGAWAQRADIPDLTFDGRNRIVPLRVDATYHLETRDPDPRGMQVVGGDGFIAGKVTDVWVDRAESLARYYELEVTEGVETPVKVLLPVNFSKIETARRLVHVRSIFAGHFKDVPRTANPDQVTRLEEERVCAYYGAGTLYATPSRSETLL